MLTLPKTVRVYLAAGATDMRKSFDTLAALVDQVIGEDPLSGHLLAFSNRARNRVKILLWDGSGYWLFAKRLEKGTFAWPRARGDQKRIQMSSEELSLLLSGIDLEGATRRRWYSQRA